MASSASFLPLYYILFLQERHSQPEVFRLPLQEAPRELLGASSFNQACFHRPFRLKVTFRIHQCNSSPSPSESGVFSLSHFKSRRFPDNRHLWRADCVLGNVPRFFVLCLDSFNSQQQSCEVGSPFSGEEAEGRVEINELALSHRARRWRRQDPA